ncbi:MAG TPA: hypothetical protein ENH95_06845 [Nitrosopumilus sp.]|nr:hypothetical protein [Nitrosopumilus sp.]
MNKLTVADYQNLLSLINRGQFSGAELETILVLKKKLIDLVKLGFSEKQKIDPKTAPALEEKKEEKKE